jgi:predicted acylesterase/phospholipase RssA
MHFDHVVFSGGGNRCFWQAGFWSVAAAALNLKPDGVAAVSAGSAVACALFAGTFEQGFVGYKKAIAGNGRNVYLRNLLRERPVFPHGDMYRNAILDSIDASALARLHQGPEIRILMSCPPRWASRRMAIMLGALAFCVDACEKDAVHTSSGRNIGFKPLYLSVRECATPAELADLIIASSCVPPLTPQATRNGVSLFDGGLVSNVPTEFVGGTGGETLVLLSRRFKALPTIPGRTYVQPSQPVQVGAWDYTDDAALQSTFDLGRRDGERFCEMSSSGWWATVH